MAEPKRILIVRFSSIGDIVLTTPVIRTVAKHFPDARIHFLTKPQYKGLLDSNPYLHQVHVLSDDWGQMMLELRSESFDLMIDLHHNLRTRLLKWNLRIPSLSFDKINIPKYLKVRFKIDILPKVHIVDRYFDTVRPLGVEDDGKGLDYFIPDKDKVDMTEFFPAQHTHYTVYAIGGQHYTKKMPVDRIREFAEQHNGYLVLIGGPEDADAGETISEGLDHVINLCGKMNVNNSASVIEQAGKVITHDTGMMHIAAAFRKKIVSIWGNTIPEFGMYPFRPDPASTILEIKDLKCRPCSKIGFDKCPKGHFKCMNLILPEMIEKAVEDLD